MKCRTEGGEVQGRLSRPARGAWIEMHLIDGLSALFGVAPRKGRVD